LDEVKKTARAEIEELLVVKLHTHRAGLVGHVPVN